MNTGLRSVPHNMSSSCQVVRNRNSSVTLAISFPLGVVTSLLLFKTASPNGATAAERQSCLPGTGQTNHYTRTFGEDSDFSGRGPSYTDNGDGTVTDMVTGLMWQKGDGGEMTWERAKEYGHNLKLGGHQDWRLPSSMELFGLMNHDRNRPALNTDFFTRTEAEYWWTDSPGANDRSRVWVVNAGGGIGAHPMRETRSAGGDRSIHVRCVRGDSPFGPGPRLHDDGDGTVTDQITGLVWQKVGPGSAMSWEEALKYCGELRLAGHDDWRLPNIKELRSINDDRKVQPSLDRSSFPQAQAASYWSSTSQCNHPERAWFVDFATGLVTYADKPERQLVLAVRGGGTVPGSRIKPPPDPKLFARPAGGRGPGGGKGKDDQKKKGGDGRRPPPNESSP